MTGFFSLLSQVEQSLPFVQEMSRVARWLSTSGLPWFLLTSQVSFLSCLRCACNQLRNAQSCLVGCSGRTPLVLDDAFLARSCNESGSCRVSPTPLMFARRGKSDSWSLTILKGEPAFAEDAREASLLIVNVWTSLAVIWCARFASLF